MNLSAQAPGQIILAPSLPGKLAWVRCRYVSGLGPIESDWRRGASQTIYNFVIPANAQATVELQTASPDEVKVDGIAAAKAPGVDAEKAGENTLELVLGSGRYHIVAANPAEKRP